MSGPKFRANTELTGLQRAAIVMLALGEEHGREIWNMLDEDEIKLVSSEMMQLGTVEAGLVEQLLREVAVIGASAPLRGDIEGTRALLSKVLPKAIVDEIIESANGPAGRTMYQKLSNVSPGLLANFLKNEHPQTAAVILSRVQTEHAARVLSEFPARLAEEVVQRMLTMEDVPREVLERIDQTLRVEFIAALNRRSRRNPIDQMSTILSAMTRAEGQRLLGAIERGDRETADKIRAKMFSFDHLAEMPIRVLHTILQRVDRSELAKALKGGPERLREAVMSTMTKRAGLLLQKEMELLGPIRLRDIDEAQSRIISIARQLEQQGEIDLAPAPASAEDDLVY
ncbi:MAG: flagellar motor switch protein FliG [Alsobacter sp.]